MPLTRFGLLSTNYSYGLPSADVFRHFVEIVDAVEASAFDSFWLPDHLVQGAVGDLHANTGSPEINHEGPGGASTPMFDAPTLLGALAACSRSLRIGPLVSPITTRHPAMLAKVAATLDVISGGRAALGIGAGWDADEHVRFGLPFPSIAERVDRLEDGVRICRAMLDECPASHRGRHHSIEAAVNLPRSVSDRIPILVGGQSLRTLRVVAKCGDACNPIGDAGLIRSTFERLDELCEELGRDPTEIARPAGVLFHRFEDVDARVEEAFAAGSDGVILMPWQLSPSPDQIMRMGERLLTRFG